MAKKEKKAVENEKVLIEIPSIKKGRLRMTIQGDTYLMVNNFSDAAKEKMVRKQLGKAQELDGPRDPEKEFQDSLYKMSKNRYGIKAMALKKAGVRACSFVKGIPMTKAMGAFHVIEQEQGLVEVLPASKNDPTMDTRITKIGPYKIPHTRYRGIFRPGWKISFEVRYNANTITPAQLYNLFNNAGFSTGIGEYRPDRSGNLGLFSVVLGKQKQD